MNQDKILNRYKQLMETTHAAVYEIDLVNQKLTYVNQTVCDMTGYSKDELLNMNVFDLLTQSSKRKFKERLVMMQNGVSVNPIEEFQIKRKDGKTLWFIITADYKWENDVIKCADVIALDITKQKKQQLKLESIYRTAPVGIGTLKYDHGKRTITQVNNRLCKMLRKCKKELIGESAAVLYPTKEEFDRVGKIKYPAIKKTGVGTLETKWIRSDGKIINILLSSTFVDLSDHESEVTFSALDITESRKFENKLERELLKRMNLWKSQVEIASPNIHKLDNIMRESTINNGY